MRFTTAAAIVLTVLVLPVGDSLAQTGPSDGGRPDGFGLPDGYWGLEETGPILESQAAAHRLDEALDHRFRVGQVLGCGLPRHRRHQHHCPDHYLHGYPSYGWGSLPGGTIHSVS